MFTYPITLEAGPGPLLAFVPEADPGALAEAAVALANADGGTIVVGLTANGWPAPALPDGESVRAALHEAAALCDPAIRWGDPAPLDSAHGPLIAVSVPRSDYVHALADGRVLVRADGSNRRLDGRAIKALVSDQATGSFETAVVPGAARDDLDLDAIRDFAARAPLPDADPLAALDATTPDGGVTVAGLLLFGRDPQRWLPYSRVQFTRVIAGHKALPPHTLTGTLPVLIDALAVLIREQMRTYRFSGDPSLAAYPADAVHEVLVNAVCHRDYRVREPVAVRLDDDHLTITSPGGLPGCMTLAHLGDGRCSRNPRIAWSLHRLGYVPEPGRGIRRLRAIMSQHSRPPQFTAEPYSVTVRLAAAQIAPDNTGTGQPTATAPTLNPRQQAALAHVETHGSITLREFGTLCNGTHTADLRRDLSDLVACGRLRKVGARGRAYYIAG